jgi:hypothetical protein
LAHVEIVSPGVNLAIADLEGPMTGSANDLSESPKTSIRSVNTTGPSTAMLTTRNSILSMPGGPGRINDAIVLAMSSLPVTGVSGMLW